MLGASDTDVITRHGLEKLKRDTLFFEKIFIIDANEKIRWHRSVDNDETKRRYLQNADELEYILQQKYFESWDHSLKAVISDAGIDPEKQTQYEKKYEQIRSIAGDLEKLGRKYQKFQRKRNFNIEELFDEEYFDRNPEEAKIEKKLSKVAKSQESLWRLIYNLSFRLKCDHISLLRSETVSGLKTLYQGPRSNEDMLSIGDVMQIAVNRVPFPAENTPWEVIFDMKRDSSLIAKARKLRIWAKDVASEEGLTAKNLEEYIEDTLFDYEQYMKYHVEKFASGRIQGALVGGSGVIEDILKLRVEKLVSRAFSFREAKLELLTSELEAPGRELSAITMVKSRFENQP